MRSRIAGLGVLACSVLATESSATVLNWSFGVENTTAIEQSYLFSITLPASIFGVVDTRLAFGIAVGDGGRDGASVGIANGAAGLAVGSLFQGATPTAVNDAGAAQSFTGAGGTAGFVSLTPVATANFDPAPLNFNFTVTEPLSPLRGSQLVQSSLVRAFADGDAPDGGSLNPNGLTPGVMQASLVSSGGTAIGLPIDLGLDALFPPDAGVFGPDSASGTIDCGDCDAVLTRLNYQQTPFDYAGLVARTEVGGDPLNGLPVTWAFSGASDGGFDCGVAGCDSMRVDLRFTVSPGDAIAFVGRFDVEAAEAVPEPAALGMLAFGCALLLSARLRRLV